MCMAHYDSGVAYTFYGENVKFLLFILRRWEERLLHNIDYTYVP